MSDDSIFITVNDNLNLILSSNDEVNLSKVEIIDLRGVIVKELIINKQLINNLNMTINTSDLLYGCYLIRLIDNNNTYNTQSMFIKR